LKNNKPANAGFIFLPAVYTNSIAGKNIGSQTSNKNWWNLLITGKMGYIMQIYLLLSIYLLFDNFVLCGTIFSVR
jgi:hypothetical protein